MLYIYILDKNIEIVKAFRYDKQMGRDIFNYNGYAGELQNESIITHVIEMIQNIRVL